jgi:hypothetical protein
MDISRFGAVSQTLTNRNMIDTQLFIITSRREAMDHLSHLVLVLVNATWSGGKEADIWGTPSGLRELANSFKHFVESRTQSSLADGTWNVPTTFLGTSATTFCTSATTIATSAKGPLVETGLHLRLELSDDFDAVATRAFSNTLRFRQSKRRYFNEDSVEYTTKRPSSCRSRLDGGFAVAYPVVDSDTSLVIAGNATGILHIAAHIEGMANVEYGQYNPNWPESSEHYHSWIDGKNDVMLKCGLGLLYGRLDHRKDGSVDWMLEDRTPNRDELEMLAKKR